MQQNIFPKDAKCLWLCTNIKSNVWNSLFKLTQCNGRRNVTMQTWREKKSSVLRCVSLCFTDKLRPPLNTCQLRQWGHALLLRRQETTSKIILVHLPLNLAHTEQQSKDYLLQMISLWLLIFNLRLVRVCLKSTIITVSSIGVQTCVLSFIHSIQFNSILFLQRESVKVTTNHSEIPSPTTSMQ